MDSPFGRVPIRGIDTGLTVLLGLAFCVVLGHPHPTLRSYAKVSGGTSS